MTANLLTKASDRVKRLPGRVKIIVLAVVVILVVAFFAPLPFMTDVSYLARIEAYAQSAESLHASVYHAEVGCWECHTDERGEFTQSLTLVGDFYRTLFTPNTAPAFIRTGTPSNDACVACHLHDWAHDAERASQTPHPAHLRVSDETRPCVDCHKYTGHQEESIEPHKEQPLSGLCATYECHAGWKPADSCDSCHHIMLDDPTLWKTIHPRGVLTVGYVRCLELCHEADQCRQCHTTGVSPFKDGIVVTERGVIEQEHAKPDWTDKHGTVALDTDRNLCFTCHVSESQCRNCHSQRPASHDPQETWTSRHKELVTREGQCLTCHEESQCEDCHELFKGSQ